MAIPARHRRVSISEAATAPPGLPTGGASENPALAALAIAETVTSERAREAQAVVAAAADRRRRLQDLYTQLAVAGGTTS